MEKKEAFKKILRNHIPETAVDYVTGLCAFQPFLLKITRHRHTRHGDFRPDRKGNFTITVNISLNRYAFLITLVHEIAHLYVHLHHKRRVPPHGKEWKKTFSELMTPLLQPSVFPPEILGPLTTHMKNPRASSSSDIPLYRALIAHDVQSTDTSLLLEELAEGELFYLNKKRKMIKGPLRRSRYLCRQQPGDRMYLVHPLVKVRRVG